MSATLECGQRRCRHAIVRVEVFDPNVSLRVRAYCSQPKSEHLLTGGVGDVPAWVTCAAPAVTARNAERETHDYNSTFGDTRFRTIAVDCHDVFLPFSLWLSPPRSRCRRPAREEGPSSALRRAREARHGCERVSGPWARARVCGALRAPRRPHRHALPARGHPVPHPGCRGPSDAKTSCISS